MINVLFVCTKNKWRSPTAETIFKRHHLIIPRSRGTSRSARRVISHADIKWADTIFVMENKHKSFINSQYQSSLDNKPVIVIDIPDDYNYMDPELIAWLEDAVIEHLKNFKTIPHSQLFTRLGL